MQQTVSIPSGCHGKQSLANSHLCPPIKTPYIILDLWHLWDTEQMIVMTTLSLKFIHKISKYSCTHEKEFLLDMKFLFKDIQTDNQNNDLNWFYVPYQVYVYLIYICSFLYYIRQIKISCKILILVIPFFFISLKRIITKTPGFSPALKQGLLPVIFTWSLT